MSRQVNSCGCVKEDGNGVPCAAHGHANTFGELEAERDRLEIERDKLNAEVEQIQKENLIAWNNWGEELERTKLQNEAMRKVVEIAGELEARDIHPIIRPICTRLQAAIKACNLDKRNHEETNMEGSPGAL